MSESAIVFRHWHLGKIGARIDPLEGRAQSVALEAWSLKL